MAALRAIAASNTTAADKKDPIVLGHSKVKDGGTLRRPEFFSACDVAVFEEYETRADGLGGGEERRGPSVHSGFA